MKIPLGGGTVCKFTCLLLILENILYVLLVAKDKDKDSKVVRALLSLSQHCEA